MRVIRKIEKQEGREYILTPNGEIFEIIKEVNKIGEIEVKEGFKYFLLSDGKIVEKEVVKLDWETFFKFKKNGRLASLYREGKEVEIDEKTIPVGKVVEYQDHFIKEALEGNKIERVDIERKSGNTYITLFLSNGKRLKVSEGLLNSSSVIEIV